MWERGPIGPGDEGGPPLFYDMENPVLSGSPLGHED